MAWIDQKREAKELVTVHMVHVRAHELNPAAHTRSSGWWKRFRQHNGVHLKMPQYEKMTRIRTEQELADLIVAYWRRLHWYRLQGRVAYNMDETRVIYESHNARTVCRLGDRNVFVKCAGKEKDGFTVMLSVNEFGQKLPPVLIFKGVKPISLFVSKSVQQPPIVLLNGKNTWLNEASMLTWMHWFVTTLGRCAGAPTAHANAHAHADADADADADAPKATTDTYNEHSMTGHVVLVMDRLATHWTGRVGSSSSAAVGHSQCASQLHHARAARGSGHSVVFQAATAQCSDAVRRAQRRCFEFAQLQTTAMETGHARNGLPMLGCGGDADGPSRLDSYWDRCGPRWFAERVGAGVALSEQCEQSHHTRLHPTRRCQRADAHHRSRQCFGLYGHRHHAVPPKAHRV
jgi:hypothetical protein